MTLLNEAPPTIDLGDLEIFEMEIQLPGIIEQTPAPAPPETDEQHYQLTKLGQWLVTAMDMERLAAIKSNTGGEFPIGVAHMLDLRHRPETGFTTLNSHERREVFGDISDEQFADFIVG